MSMTTEMIRYMGGKTNVASGAADTRGRKADSGRFVQHFLAGGPRGNPDDGKHPFHIPHFFHHFLQMIQVVHLDIEAYPGTLVGGFRLHPGDVRLQRCDRRTESGQDARPTC